jgi:hypothetical protein
MPLLALVHPLEEGIEGEGPLWRIGFRMGTKIGGYFLLSFVSLKRRFGLSHGSGGSCLFNVEKPVSPKTE